MPKNTDDGRSLGEVLRDARLTADLSLRELAAKLSITASYISDIENDHRVPSEEVLRGYSREFDLPFDRLMALAGRVGDEAERFLKQRPIAGVLFRRIADKRLSEEQLQEVLKHVERIDPKKGSS